MTKNKLTRYIKETQETLTEMKECLKCGWYLGNRIDNETIKEVEEELNEYIKKRNELK